MTDEREELLDGRAKLNNIVDRSNYNKSVYFILPMIGLDSRYFSLINSYLGDATNKKEDIYSKIYVNIKYNDEKLRANPFYDCEYILPDRTMMYVFDVPEAFERDYTLFCEGQYSKFSDLYKDQIMKYLIKPVQTTRVYKILYKTEDRRKYIEDLVGQSIGDQEVCSKPDLEREIYN